MEAGWTKWVSGAKATELPHRAAFQKQRSLEQSANHRRLTGTFCTRAVLGCCPDEGQDFQTG